MTDTTAREIAMDYNEESNYDTLMETGEFTPEEALEELGIYPDEEELEEDEYE